jgi:hypothetical protein
MKKTWWNAKYGKDSICAITKCRLRPGKDKYGFPYVAFLPCKHGFYRSALDLWIQNTYPNQTCPLCRKEFQVMLV